MAKSILAAVVAYLLSVCVFTAVGSAIGSFVFAEWWTPLSSVDGRGVVAWFSLAPALIAFLTKLEQSA